MGQFQKRLIAWIAISGAVYHIVVLSQLLGFLGIFVPLPLHRAISLLFALVLVFLTRSGTSKSRVGMPPWYDLIILGAGLVGSGFVIFFFPTVLDYGSYGYLDTKGIILCLLLAVAVLEAVRRMTGILLPTVILLILLATMFNNHLPGLLAGKGYALDRLGYSIYVGSGGIFGIPLGVAASILIIFLIFSRLFQAAGGGEWFLDIALSLTGRMRGGAAKAAVVSSAFFGMISGSPSANTATTGTFTIPLMVRTGFIPEVAGAVEAAASAGGQIMPPVMGSIAFLMAEWLGIPYASVARAALVPAILYFVIIFASVHLEALRIGLQPLAPENIPPFLKSLTAGWFFLLPIAGLVYFLLIEQYSPELAGLFALPLLVLCSFFHPDRSKWLTLKNLAVCLQDSMLSWLTIAVVTASVGMIVGSLELSGLSVKISGFIVDVSGGQLLIILFLVGVASLVLGMGLDSIPLYITLTILTAPALIKLGVPELAAHLYVVYWGLASFLTPPVCLGVYVACSISGADVWKTGWEAVKLGVGKFLLPLAFVLEPGLLLDGSAGQIAFATLTALLGCVALSAGVRGMALGETNWIQRCALIIGGILAILPGVAQFLIGFVLIAFSLAWQWTAMPKAAASRF
ncbi:MAG: TRAP transporter permease [Alphaproteobacteria bacterium]